MLEWTYGGTGGGSAARQGRLAGTQSHRVAAAGGACADPLVLLLLLLLLAPSRRRRRTGGVAEGCGVHAVAPHNKLLQQRGHGGLEFGDALHPGQSRTDGAGGWVPGEAPSGQAAAAAAAAQQQQQRGSCSTAASDGWRAPPRPSQPADAAHNSALAAASALDLFSTPCGTHPE